MTSNPPFLSSNLMAGNTAFSNSNLMAGFTAFLSSNLMAGFTIFFAISSNNIICNLYKFIAFCILNIPYFLAIINIFRKIFSLHIFYVNFSHYFDLPLRIPLLYQFLYALIIFVLVLLAYLYQ